MIRREVRIEFIGGPFDGHTQEVYVLPASLPKHAGPAGE